MSYPFASASGPILVKAELSGPAASIRADLMLDTGATTTVLSRRLLAAVGCDPAASPDVVTITAGSGTVTAPRLMINRLTALGRHAIGLRVLAHDLPPGAGVDGLLGLDFLRGMRLTLDFRAGEIDLA